MRKIKLSDINPKPIGKPKFNKFELFTIEPNNWKLSIMLCQIELKRNSFVTKHALIGWRWAYQWANKNEFRICLFFMEFAYYTKNKEYAENDKH